MSRQEDDFAISPEDVSAGVLRHNGSWYVTAVLGHMTTVMTLETAMQFSDKIMANIQLADLHATAERSGFRAMIQRTSLMDRVKGVFGIGKDDDESGEGVPN